jgi:hypothetical protein
VFFFINDLCAQMFSFFILVSIQLHHLAFMVEILK